MWYCIYDVPPNIVQIVELEENTKLSLHAPGLID